MRFVFGTTLGALKNVKFRLSRISTKFDVIAKFRETIPTMKPVSSSEIKKFISDLYRNYYFTIFQKFRIFPGFTLILQMGAYAKKIVKNEYNLLQPFGSVDSWCW